MLVCLAEVADSYASVREGLDGKNGATIHPIRTNVFFHHVPGGQQVTFLGYPEARADQFDFAAAEIEAEHRGDAREEVEFFSSARIRFEEHCGSMDRIVSWRGSA